MSQSNSTRREFLQKLGFGVAAGGAALLSPGAFASPVARSGRGVLDNLLSPSNSVAPSSLDKTAQLGDIGDTYYYIKSNGLPDHTTGAFPNSNCPGPILPQAGNFRIAKAPKLAPVTTPLNGWLFGIGVNGVAFDPTGPFYKGTAQTGWTFEVMTAIARPTLGLDFNNAHIQPSGEYHYHGMPVGLVGRLELERQRRAEAPRMLLLGYAADGFPIYAPMGHSNPLDPNSPLVDMRSSYALKSGFRTGGNDCPGGRHEVTAFVQDWEYRPGTGHLDECNGRFGVTPEHPQGIYHYFITREFPFVPRFYRGTPDASFFHPLPGLDAVPKALMNIDFKKL